MNILIVTGIFPPDIGGPATYVPAVSAELAKRGHNITVVTLSDSLAHDDRFYRFGIVRIRRGVFKPWRFLLTVAAIVRKGRRADLIYVNGLYPEAVAANFLLRKPLAQKIVGDWAWERASNKGWVRDTFEEFQSRKHSAKVELLKALRRFCSRRADVVIVPSRYLAAAIAHWGVPATKTKIVYNAVDSVRLTPASVPLSAKIKLVTVGRLIPLKRIDSLIGLLPKCPDTGLVIVGDGPERERLQDLVCKLGLEASVYFAGKKSKEETLALMAACDLFVLNSTHEAFPHVALEAMSVGLPVIATAVGGTPEVVRDGKNGALIAPNASGALSAMIANLCSSATERERLVAGAKRTVERFRYSTMIEETEAVLSSCVNPDRAISGWSGTANRMDSMRIAELEDRI